jgi:hypothetical protein
MLEEYNHSLAVQCMDAVREICEEAISKIEAYFYTHYVPDKFATKEEFMEYMAEALIPLNGKERKEHPLYKESQECIKATIEELSLADRFAIRCLHIEQTDKNCTDRGIAKELMEQWMEILDCVYDELVARKEKEAKHKSKRK